MSEERDSGLQALQNGDTVAAIEQLERATQQDPSDYQAFLYLGAAYGQANRTDDAIKTLTSAVQLQPSNAQARFNLGIAMERAGYTDQAVTLFEQALQLQPDYSKAQESLDRLRPPAPAGLPPVAPNPSAGFGAAAEPTSGYATGPAPIGPGGYASNAQPVLPAQAPTYSPPGLGTPGSLPPSAQPYQSPAAYNPGVSGQFYAPGYGGATEMQNTSGMKGPVPFEVEKKGWSWGGFGLHWIWLCAHNMVGYGILLLVCSCIPLVGLIGAIYLGVNGNKLAWQNRRYESLQQFEIVEGLWAKWGIGIFVLSLVLGGIYGFVVATTMLAAVGHAGGGFTPPQ